MTARKRVTAAALARLLDAVDRPIYMLNDRRRIVFCNRACLDWVAIQRDDLLGRQCRYYSLAAVPSHEQTHGLPPEGETAAPATDPGSTVLASAERPNAPLSRRAEQSTAVDRAEAAACGLCPSPAVFQGNENQGIVACHSEDGTLRRRLAQFVQLSDSEGRLIGLIALVDPVDLPDQQAASTAAWVQQPACRAQLSEAEKLHDLLRQFQREAAARWGLHRLVGTTPAARLARRQVQTAAHSGESVLIVGPPGSGRQRTAYTIHFNSRRATHGPLVPLACSVLGAELIGSTIAAIVSAGPSDSQQRVGTLLLNQVDCLPPELQRELVSVLDRGEFPARLIATAERPLLELAQHGGYNDRLAAALSTLVIRLPALAERREDVPLLAQAFLEQLNAQGQKQLAGFSPEALDALHGYHWPGNIDELYQFVVSACKRATGPYVELKDLPERIHLAADAASQPAPLDQPIQLDQFLGQVERELVARALRLARGNKARAARLLGLSRPRLYRRMVQLGLEPPASPPAGEKPDARGPD